ncbi:MAG: prenyltransferase [Actinomycetota bacterium]
MRAPEVVPALTTSDAGLTAASILEAQRLDGCIPWWPDGPADAWNHVEAAMGLDAAGHHSDAERAYRWLSGAQRADGSWAIEYRDGKPHNAGADANFCAYVATGVLHHWLMTSDRSFLSVMWPTVECAVRFVLALQEPDGRIWWARDEDGHVFRQSLLTSCASIAHSLSSANQIARILGHERPSWHLARQRLVTAIRRETRFADKRRFAMDWYYPVLSGSLPLDRSAERLDERWDEFVIAGKGCRCVSDRPWVTAAETFELAICLVAVGRSDLAAELFAWTQNLRCEGAYWTGATWPDGTVWPREKTSWTAGAALLACDALSEGIVLDLFGP